MKVNKCKKLYIHTLVAKTFLDNPNYYKFVKHIDGNKLNNNIENLKWVKCSIDAKYKNNIEENEENEIIKIKNNPSGYRGVIFIENLNKWRSSISHKNY
jgi:hypothetical protein